MIYIKAFIIGGSFCMLGQILIDKTALTPAKILVSYVIAGVMLSGLGVYEHLIDFAGGGASVPLTGFGHIMASGVRQAVDEVGFLGIFLGGIKSAAAGITAAIVAGLLSSFIFKAKDKS